MNKKVLVIDDEESIRFTFKRFLASNGYEVDTAGGFEEAVGLLGRSRYDLVFADIILGGRTGIDVLSEVRKRGLGCPVVIVTGVPTVETAAEALRLGAIDYIPKPFEKDLLLRTARMVLKNSDLAIEKERYRTNLEAIFRSVDDAIISVDTDLRLTELNGVAERISGLSRGAIGSDLGSLEGLGGARCSDALTETIENNRSVSVDRLVIKPADGHPGVFSLKTSPLIDAGGEVAGAVMVLRDETRLDGLERDLRERRGLHNMVGKSPRMQDVYSLIEELSDLPSTVLITGESGTGKELVAEALHYGGQRGVKPLVKVNCSALSESLLESELFGHVRGAFTGAMRDKPGRFELADGGTIFLDEIGDISPVVQTRLLRVLQSREFERVGDATPIKVDVRVVAATNRDLKDKVSSGAFREDLYYRLKVVEMHVPPLRERREDIPLLAERFIRRLNGMLNKQIDGVSEEVLELFMCYPWPGNIRELEHALEHASILCRSPLITVSNLPPDVRAPSSREAAGALDASGERRELLRALEESGWKKARAARLLGMSRSTIYRKIRKYGLDKG